MSLIYEALEKLEQEKKGRLKPPLPESAAQESVSDTGVVAKKANPRVIYGIGGILLILFVLGLIYLLANSLPAPATPQETKSLSSLTSQALFSLTGITGMGSDKTAIVNNQLVRVGDWVSGARVQSIEGQEVILDFRGQSVTLSLY